MNEFVLLPRIEPPHGSLPSHAFGITFLCKIGSPAKQSQAWKTEHRKGMELTRTDQTSWTNRREAALRDLDTCEERIEGCGEDVNYVKWSYWQFPARLFLEIRYAHHVRGGTQGTMPRLQSVPHIHPDKITPEKMVLLRLREVC